MRILIFLVITLSFFGTVAYAGPETKDSDMAASDQKQSSSECSCSVRKQHQMKLRIEKNKQNSFESDKEIISEPSSNE